MYILTSPFFKTFDTKGLIYLVPDFLCEQMTEWILVEVPIGKKVENALVLELIYDIEMYLRDNNLTFSEEKIKSIVWIVSERVFLEKNVLLLIQEIADRYICQIHKVTGLFFQNDVRKKIHSLDEKFFWILDQDNQEKKIPEKNITFSREQEKAYNEICDNFEKKNDKINVLYGVTGSGKTHIYLQLLAEVLVENKQWLLLIPEIVLNNQIWWKITDFFWEENVIIINSSLTALQRIKAWARIFSWEKLIVVWTRSALFFPYKNLNIIIMDEEHDASYVSDKSPRYNVKEVLVMMKKYNPSLKLLLWSWTPSINSMYKAVKWEWNLVSLLEKYK